MQANKPVLSICVPSRNRQFYFQATIRALTASARSDVEFVFVDNSDDPMVMDSFIAPYIDDPRVKYIPSGETVRPMVDNWEVAIAATTGRWVSFIGDDDYMDPDAAGLFAKIEAASPDVDAIDWNKLNYFWPDDRRPALARTLSLQTEIHRVPKALLVARAFQWQSASQVIVSGFSIYHGAVSRRLLDRIKRLYGNRQFEHPIVDYDSVLKIIMNGENFIYCRRPLSVLGVCPLSQSAALGNRDKADKSQADFHKEHKVSMDDWECYRDYPFRSRHGVTACIGMVHHWFSTTYGHKFAGFEANFAEACAIQCSQSENIQQFDLFSNAYRESFRRWKKENTSSTSIHNSSRQKRNSCSPVISTPTSIFLKALPGQRRRPISTNSLQVFSIGSTNSRSILKCIGLMRREMRWVSRSHGRSVNE